MLKARIIGLIDWLWLTLYTTGGLFERDFYPQPHDIRYLRAELHR